MTPATLAGLSGHMDRTELAERAGIDLRMLSVILARAHAMKLAGDNTYRRALRTLVTAQDIIGGDLCPECFGVGKKHQNGLYACGCDL